MIEIKINIIKEELQKNILYSIYSRESNVYFMWWTNLRICYNLDRFSEDLDFELDKPDKNYDIKKLLELVSNDFKEKKLFEINIKSWENRTVKKAFIKFPNILKDTKISNLKDEKVSIKLEIDTNPASWAEYSSEIVKSAFWTFLLKNHNINTTFSWKMWALILREYFKWRDYYDMYWYLENYSHKVFNLEYLSNVISQYNYNNELKVSVPEDYKNALNMVLDKIKNTDYEKVKSDLVRFISWDKEHLNIFFKNYPDKMFTMIKKYYLGLEWNREDKFRL